MSWAEALVEWLRPLVVLAVLAGVADLLLPTQALRRHVGLVFGLVVLAALLGPVLRLLEVDLPAAIARSEAALAAARRGAGREAGDPLADGRRLQERQAREAFRRLLEAEAARVVADLPGVGAVEVAVELAEGPGQPPPLRQVRVRVVPGPRPDGGVASVQPVVPVGVAPGAAPGPQPLPAGLEAEIRRRLEERLGVPGRRVRVEPLPSGRR